MLGGGGGGGGGGVCPPGIGFDCVEVQGLGVCGNKEERGKKERRFLVGPTETAAAMGGGRRLRGGGAREVRGGHFGADGGGGRGEKLVTLSTFELQGFRKTSLDFLLV